MRTCKIFGSAKTFNGSSGGRRGETNREMCVNWQFSLYSYSVVILLSAHSNYTSSNWRRFVACCVWSNTFLWRSYIILYVFSQMLKEIFNEKKSLMTAIDSSLSKMIHVRMGKKLLVVLRCECFCFFWNMLSNLPQYFSPGLASSTISLWPPQQPAKKPPMFLFFFLVEKVINCPRKIVLSQVWRRKADNRFAIVSDFFF